MKLGIGLVSVYIDQNSSTLLQLQSYKTGLQTFWL